MTREREDAPAGSRRRSPASSLFHESVDPADPRRFTRRWFSRADMLYVELVLASVGLVPADRPSLGPRLDVAGPSPRLDGRLTVDGRSFGTGPFGARRARAPRRLTMDLELTGKIAVVTGASKGIGLAVVRALAAEGVLVVAGARTVDTLGGIEGVTPVAVDLVDARGFLAPRRRGGLPARTARCPRQQRRWC